MVFTNRPVSLLRNVQSNIAFFDCNCKFVKFIFWCYTSLEKLSECWVPFHHISIITSNMRIQFVIFEQDYLQLFFYRKIHIAHVYSLAIQQDSKFMIFAFAFECFNIGKFDFVNVMNCYSAIYNHMFVFLLSFTFKHVG